MFGGFWKWFGSSNVCMCEGLADLRQSKRSSMRTPSIWSTTSGSRPLQVCCCFIRPHIVAPVLLITSILCSRQEPSKKKITQFNQPFCWLLGLFHINHPHFLFKPPWFPLVGTSLFGLRWSATMESPHRRGSPVHCRRRRNLSHLAWRLVAHGKSRCFASTHGSKRWSKNNFMKRLATIYEGFWCGFSWSCSIGWSCHIRTYLGHSFFISLEMANGNIWRFTSGHSNLIPATTDKPPSDAINAS